ncbi:MAG: hypothetical protein RLZZ546_425 [Bacteroidota bacterium]|jgi:uncharacterized protein (TIGR02453 family)
MQLDSAILDFLTGIDKNNNKVWFTKNKPFHDEAYKKFKEFCTDLIASGLRKRDDIEDVKVFRIYRDVRFSKDKTPYKNNFGAGFTRAGKRLRGGYYLHIEPNNSFVGGGFWDPNPQDLKRIRDEFSFDPHTIMKIQKEKNFKKYFGEIKGDGVKTCPRGYDINLPCIELIKKKQFVVMRPFTNEELLKKNFSEEVVKTFEAMRPFFNFMSDVLTTDLNGESIL